MTDIRQTKAYGSFLRHIGWKIETVNGNQIFIKKVPLLGSAIKLQRTHTLPLKEVNLLAKKYRAFEIIVEPISTESLQELIDDGFRISNSPFLPTKTIQLDITPPLAKIQSAMKKDARYSIKKSSHIALTKCESIEKFRSAWKHSVGTKRHVLPMSDLKAFQKAFGQDMLLLLNSDHSAGGFFIKADKTVYYWAGFTHQTARKSLVQYQVIWNAIEWAKQNGATIFDFEGIYDPRFPKKQWIGFTHFKKSFGGEEVSFPGCFIKWRLPF